MKTLIKLSLIVLILSIFPAYTTVKDDGLNLTYGVSESNPAQIELRLFKDYTFTYQDFSVNAKKIVVSGTYELKKNKVQLNAVDEGIKFHDKWKISKDRTTANSRKGITFYTLRIKN